MIKVILNSWSQWRKDAIARKKSANQKVLRQGIYRRKLLSVAKSIRANLTQHIQIGQDKDLTLGEKEFHFRRLDEQLASLFRMRQSYVNFLSSENTAA